MKKAVSFRIKLEFQPEFADFQDVFFSPDFEVEFQILKMHFYFELQELRRIDREVAEGWSFLRFFWGR